MSGMFEGASAFDQDLGWCVGINQDIDDAFEDTLCASTSCGVTQGQFKTEDGSCESTPAPTTQWPPVAPSMTFAPTPTPLPYEYVPTENAMPYCRLQSSSVCWGNTHRFLEVTANGPFDGINLGSSSGDYTPAPVLVDFDGDGTLRQCPLIDKPRQHVSRRRSGPRSGQ